MKGVQLIHTETRTMAENRQRMRRKKRGRCRAGGKNAKSCGHAHTLTRSGSTACVLAVANDLLADQRGSGRVSHRNHPAAIISPQHLATSCRFNLQDVSTKPFPQDVQANFNWTSAHPDGSLAACVPLLSRNQSHACTHAHTDARVALPE